MSDYKILNNKKRSDFLFVYKDDKGIKNKFKVKPGDNVVPDALAKQLKESPKYSTLFAGGKLVWVEDRIKQELEKLEKMKRRFEQLSAKKNEVEEVLGEEADAAVVEKTETNKKNNKK